MKETLKVGVSGVRGIVGRSFTPQLAAGFAQAFGSFVGRGAVVVGRDTRPSGPMIEQAVIAGLQSVGCRPLLAGIVPTPTLLLLTKHLGCRGGIVITASHNPMEWNALKFVGRQGVFLDDTMADQLFDIYHQQVFTLAPESEIPQCEGVADAMGPHREAIARFVDTESVRRRRFKVAMDCCNGVGAVHSPAFLREVLGCEVVPLFDRPNGLFEREPEPLPANLGALCAAVREAGCDVGFAQDPDGDRLIVVDEKGVAHSEDLPLALAVRQVLDRHERGPVAINLSTSKAVEMLARQRGSDVIRTPIGGTHVTKAMLAAGAVVGGEGNGGIIVPAIHPCRDSFAGMALLLELMVVTGQSMSALAASVPSYSVVREKLSIRAEEASDLLRVVRRAYAAWPQRHMDGVFVDMGEASLHVRRSNTEPVLRLVAEAPTRERAVELMAGLRILLSAPSGENIGVDTSAEGGVS